MWEILFERQLWRTASDIALGVFAACTVTGCGDKAAVATTPPPAPPPSLSRPVPPSRKGASEVRIEARITGGNRCIVQGVSINGRAQSDLLADSGAPDMWFPVGDLPKLGIKKSSLDFRPFGAREGNVAWVTLDKVQVGDFVARNVQAGIADGKEFDWRLLGMSVLKQGHMEIQGDTCTLTFPRNAVRSASIEEPAYKPGDRSGMQRLIDAGAPDAAAVEPQRAANGEPMGGLCQFFLRNRQVGIFADSVAYCEKHGGN
jgi:gag-polyprotein putative aspartyl protease